MSTEQNKAIVERIYTEVNDGQRYDALNEICHPDIIVHDPIGGEQRGIEAYRELFVFFRQAFGEQRTELHTFVAEGDYVALLHTHHARNTGPFLGARRPIAGSWYREWSCSASRTASSRSSGALTPMSRCSRSWACFP